MQNYELTIVLPGKATAAKKKNTVEKIEKMVKALKGNITKSEEWGEKELAYSIKKNESGLFVNFDLELPTDMVKSINDKIKLEDEVIRHLLVVKGR